MSYYNDIAWAASQYGTDAGVLAEINRLENSGSAEFVVNDWDSNARRGTPSAGPFQFIEPTFNAYARSAREANPAAWRNVPLDWRNPKAQALAAAWAIKNGKGSAWTTYQKALKAKGKGPVVAAPSATSPSRVTSSGPKADPFAAMAKMSQKRLGLMSGEGGDDDLARLSQGKWDLLDKLKSIRGRQLTEQPDMQGGPVVNAGGTAGGGPVPRQRKGEPDWKYLQRIGTSMFGLANDPGDSQTTGGRHTAGSNHYSGRAIDFGDARNSRAQLNAWYAYLNANRKRLGIIELLDEGDHIHAAIR